MSKITIITILLLVAVIVGIMLVNRSDSKKPSGKKAPKPADEKNKSGSTSVQKGSWSVKGFVAVIIIVLITGYIIGRQYAPSRNAPQTSQEVSPKGKLPQKVICTEPGRWTEWIEVGGLEWEATIKMRDGDIVGIRADRDPPFYVGNHQGWKLPDDVEKVSFKAMRPIIIVIERKLK